METMGKLMEGSAHSQHDMNVDIDIEEGMKTILALREKNDDCNIDIGSRRIVLWTGATPNGMNG